MSSSKNIKKTSWYKGLDVADKNFLEKLTLDPRGVGDRDTVLKYTGNTVSKIFNRQLQNITDVKNIFKVLPQLSFPRKILVSSILSPGDITKTGVVIDNTLKLSDYSLTAQMTAMVEELLVEELEIPTKISTWVDDALILEGSHPILTLPSSVVDTIMGISMESSTGSVDMRDEDYIRPVGILGVKNENGSITSFENSTRFGRESHIKPWNVSATLNSGNRTKTYELPIIITDNPAFFAKSIVNEMKTSNVNTSAYGDISLESMVRYPDPGGKKPKFLPADIRRDMFKSANTKMERVLILPTPKDVEEDVNIGHPIEYHWPADSIIPITSPGDPEDHKHYILLFDENGYPISGIDRLQTATDIQQAIRKQNDGDNVSSALLTTATETLGMTVANYDSHVVDEMARINSALIESEVTRAIMAGANGAKAKIELSDSVSKLMLARTLKGHRTVMLYVPADYVTYMAFNYNEIGLGKSILEDSKSMASMLSTLTVANIIGSVEQAIPGKNLSIKLDPTDKDPLGTATFMAREAMDLNFRRFPMGLNSTLGVAEELQMNSYSVTIEGHPSFPEISAEMRAKESSRQPIDTDLMDKLNDYMHLIFNVPPELTGSANQADFATTVVANNLMLLKTVIEMQTIANKHLSRYARNYVRYSGVMVARFFNLIKENKAAIPAEYKKDIPGFISDFIDSIRIRLPSPETNNLDNQIELLSSFGDAVETAMDNFLNEESLLIEGYKPEIIQSVLPTIRASYKHYAMRQYMRDRNILSELDIFKIGDEDNPTINLSDEICAHSKHVIKSIRKFINSMADVLKPEITELKKTVEKDKKAKENAEEVNNSGQPEEDDHGDQADGADDYSGDGSNDSDYGDSDDDAFDEGSDDGDSDSDGDSDDSTEDLPVDDVDEDQLDEEPDDESESEETDDKDDDKEQDKEDDKEESEDDDVDDLPIDKTDEDKL